MNPPHLRSLDLNLLVVLDALLRERSVSRAAQELAMTQPAVSHALARLRALFDDELLQRHGNAMRATPRAEALLGPLQEVLQGVRGLTSSSAPPLSEVERTVRVSLVDFAISGLLPGLLARTRRDAPRLTIACVAWSTSDKHAEGLERGTCDLVLGSFGSLPPDIVRRRLGEVPFVGVARADHPMFTRKKRAPHDCDFIVVSATGQTTTPLDAALPTKRRVVASVPGFAGVPPVVAASDLVAYVPSPVVDAWNGSPQLRTFEAPPELVAHPVELAWHRRFEPDVAHRFVREYLVDAMRATLAGSKVRPKFTPSRPRLRRSEWAPR
jgi:DNA-binding transcriptional LysR family regulator